ncbi:hypothetical protein ACFLT1_02210 [Bacteroidota bacterium]
MKNNILVLLIIFGFFVNPDISAQEKEKKVGISFSGFVKNDFFWDSRQTVSCREGHFLLWPSPVNTDANGTDINAKSNFNFLALQSRLSAKISGPDAFGAHTSAIIEGDFFAQANDNINLFRLRHALIKLSWDNTELLTGQYWNPLFVTACFPGTVSFNTGTPLQSFARNPQIRVTQSIGNISIMVAALSQRDYTSTGPDPDDNSCTLGSSQYLRNSSIPDMHLQLQYAAGGKENGSSFLAGISAAYKTIVPRLASDITGMAVNESVSGMTLMAFSKLQLSPVTIKIQGRYGENISDVLSISGFAVKSITNPTTGEFSYTPLKNMTFWGEIHTNGSKFQLGIFGGYLMNMGTKDQMTSNTNVIYGLGANISSLYRVAPRIVYTVNKTKIATELEFTSAEYGSNFNDYYVPSTTTSASNTRLLISVIQGF